MRQGGDNSGANAIKALKEVENPTIKWQFLKKNEDIILTITDNGKGAAYEDFKALYDDQEVSSIKTGLGLHLISDLAKAINCQIKVASVINIGTTISLHF